MNAMVDESVLENSVSSSSLELRVRSLNSPDVSVCVEVDCLVGDLKTILADRTSIPKTNQRLIYKGKVLQDDLALGEYQVETGHTLHLVPRQGDGPAEYEGGGGSPSNNGEQRQANGGDAAGRPWVQMPITMNIPGREEGGEAQGSDGPWVRSSHPPNLSALLTALGAPVILGEPRGGSAGQGGAAALNVLPASRVISGLFQGDERTGNNVQNSGEGPGGIIPQGPIWPPQTEARDSVRGEEENSVRRASRGIGGSELEHIRQGLLTLQTLLQAMRDRTHRRGRRRQEGGSHRNSALQDLPEGGMYRDSRENNAVTAQELLARDEQGPCAGGSVDTESSSGDATAIGTELPERESQAEDNIHVDNAEREVTAESAPAQSEPSISSAVAPRWHFFVGQWLDVKDTVNQWLEATVMDIRFPEDGDGPSELLIHYNGWPEQWDEWIACNSTRLAPFCTRTTWDIHRANTFGNFGGTSYGGPGMHLSPMTCYERDDNTPSTGSDDVRVLFPQAARLVSEVLPAIQMVVENFQQGIVSQSPDDTAGSSTGEEVSRLRHLRQRQMSWQQHEFQDENMAPLGSELSQETELMAHDLAPLLDRLGRILSDVAPALANVGRDRRSSGSHRDEEGRRSSGSSLSQPSSQVDTSGLSSATAPGHERRVRGRYELNRRGPSIRLRQRSARSSVNGEETRSPSPDSAFRRLVHTGGGSIDIHIHAIMPLRPNLTAASRPPVNVPEEGVGGEQSNPAQMATPSPVDGNGMAEEEGGGGAGGVSSGNVVPADEGGGGNVHAGGRTTSRTTAGGNSAITSVSGGVGANASALSSMSSPAHGLLFALPLSGSSLGGQLVQVRQSRSVNGGSSEPAAAMAADDMENTSPYGPLESTEADHVETRNVTTSETMASGSHHVSLQPEISDSTYLVPALSPSQNDCIDAQTNFDTTMTDTSVHQNEELPPAPCDNEQEETTLGSVSSATVNRSSENTMETNVEIPCRDAVASTENGDPIGTNENNMEISNSNCELAADASHPIASLEEQGTAVVVEQEVQSPPSDNTLALSPRHATSSSRWRWIRRGFMRRSSSSGQRG